MEVDTSRQAKRKRSPETTSFPAKKPKAPYAASSGKGEAGRDKELVREEARSLFKAYEVLLKAKKGAASLEKKRSSLGALLKAAEGGSLAGKRLAARLIPRFIELFTEEFPKAMGSLLDLVVMTAAESQHQQHRMLLEGLRRDALEGLGKACNRVVMVIDKPEQLLRRVVNCLLRQITRPQFAPQQGSGSNGVSNHQSEYSLLLSSIAQAFRTAPREVITECLHAWRDDDTSSASSAGATIVFEKVLLADSKNMSLMDDNSQRYGYSNGSGSCLAADVLSSHPDTVQWLGHTVYTIMQEDGSCPRNYHALLEGLLHKLPVPKQETYPPHAKDAQSLALHSSRHGSYRVSSPNLTTHLKSCPPQSCMPPPRQTSDSAHLSQWNKGLQPHDDGPCVWFASMPHPVGKERLGEFCSKYGHVTSVVFPPAPCHEKALVVFQSPRQASICCHHVLSSRGLSGGQRICATVPAAGNPCRTREPISTCIWVGGTPSQNREQEVLNTIVNSNLPLPRHMIVINGGHNCPGYVLELQFLRLVSQTLECLEPIDMQHFESDVPPPVPPKPPQMDAPSRHSHSRSHEKPWKMSRSQQKALLPPGTWGSRSSEIGSLSTMHFPPPPPLPQTSHGTRGVQSAHSCVPATSDVAPLLDKSRGSWRKYDPGNLEGVSRISPNCVGEKMECANRRLRWAGTLAKSGDTLCKVKCWDSPNLLRRGSPTSEPREWPEVLDVRLRVDLNTALKCVGTPGERTLLYLSAADSHSDLQGLKGFIQYLMDRMRAGVVKLRDDSRKGPDRTLYLIPPTRAVAKALDIDIGSGNSLLVLVISDLSQTGSKPRR